MQHLFHSLHIMVMVYNSEDQAQVLNIFLPPDRLDTTFHVLLGDLTLNIILY